MAVVDEPRAPAGSGHARAPRSVERRRALPGGRPVVGALLMAVAGIGVFVAHADAGRGPTRSYAVAARDLRPGEVLDPGDIELVAMDLPGSVAAAAFGAGTELSGRAVLGPIGRGQIVQAGALSADHRAEPGHEVALVVPRGHVAAGRMQPGDRVDVYATAGDRTRLVIGGARLLSAGGLRGGAIGGDRDAEIVVAVPTPELVAEVVHALRTAEVTIVRSTFAEAVAGDAVAGGAGGDPGGDEPDDA